MPLIKRPKEPFILKMLIFSTWKYSQTFLSIDSAKSGILHLPLHPYLSKHGRGEKSIMGKSCTQVYEWQKNPQEIN